MKKHILVVEDEQSLRDLFTYLLQKEGFETTTVTNGEEGYTKMQQGGYDMVLLDIMLPSMSGIEILKKLQTNPPLSTNHTIVMLTNVSEEKYMQESLALGAVGCIVKSNYTPDELIHKIKEFLPL